LATALQLDVGRDGLEVGQGGVQLRERLEPAVIAGPGQVGGKLADLDPGALELTRAEGPNANSDGRKVEVRRR
jgi:hypothetical protein